MAGSGVRLSSATMDEARKEAVLMDRSISSQVEHWARIGRAIESMPGFDHRKVAQALNGLGRIEDMTEREKAVFNDTHRKLMKTPGQQALDHFARLRAQDDADGVDISALGD